MNSKEIATEITATVKVQTWVAYENDTGQRDHEQRTVEVSLHERLDSSEDIHEAFLRLADIATRGGKR